MNKSMNFLDTDTSVLDTKLRFVHNELEDNINELLGTVTDDENVEKSRPYKIIRPDPGFCVKAHRVTNNEKCFINICTSDGIPAPEDITADQFTEILSSETPSNYKIPMSITELRLTPDKSGKDAIVCDVAIHPQFFRKIEALIIFRDFLITIIFEALDTKYNIQIDRDSWIILKNRKSMGILVKHRVQNRDVQKVYESYQNPTKAHKTLINELKSDGGEIAQTKTLITEIDTKTSKFFGKGKSTPTPTLSSSKPILTPPSKSVSSNKTRKPEFRLFKSTASGTDSVIVEYFLPEVMSLNEISLDLNRDRIVLEARRSGYLLDSFFPFNVDVELAVAEFNSTKHVLTVKIPVSS